MSFISAKNLRAEMSVTSTADDLLLKDMIAAIENIWDVLTNKTWELSEYREEVKLCGGVGFLKHYPIVSLNYLASSLTIAFEVICDVNTYGTLSIEQDKIVLNFDSTSESLRFNSFPTIQNMVDAISAITGWTASLVEKGASSIKECPVVIGVNCKDTASIYTIDEFFETFSIDHKNGTITTLKSAQYAWAYYKAGYTEDTLPLSVKQVLIRQGSHWYRQAKGKNWDYSKIDKMEGGTVDFAKVNKYNLLPDFILLANTYRKTNI